MRIATLVLSLILLGETADSPPKLAPETLDHWLEYLLPTDAECGWEEIPWGDRFWEAIITGQESERPVLLWAMNGHPLGCT